MISIMLKINQDGFEIDSILIEERCTNDIKSKIDTCKELYNDCSMDIVYYGGSSNSIEIFRELYRYILKRS